MADMREHIKALNERRIRIANEQRNDIDDAHRAHPGEPFTAEENEKLARQDEAIRALDAEINAFVAREVRESESAAGREVLERAIGAPAAAKQAVSEADAFRAFTRGKSHGNTTSDTGKPASVSYTHLTLPTKPMMCRSRWSPYH